MPRRRARRRADRRADRPPPGVRVCSHQGTLRYLTYPLHSRWPVEDRPLLGAFCVWPGRGAYDLGRMLSEQLRRRLGVLGIGTSEGVLLHEAFYDVGTGEPQQPVVEGYF